MYATDGADRVVQVGYIRDKCDEVAQKRINKTTFSRWCRWLKVSGSRADFVTVPIGASLLTFAALYRYGIRSYKGAAYGEIYPIAYRKLVEEVSYDGSSEARPAAAGASEAGTENQA